MNQGQETPAAGLNGRDRQNLTTLESAMANELAQVKTSPNLKPGRKPGALGALTRLSDAYAAELAKQVKGGKITNAEAISNKIVHHALKGKSGQSVAAAKELADRVEGKPRQSIEVTQTLDPDVIARIADIADRMNGGKTIPGKFVHPQGCGCLDCQQKQNDEAQANRKALAGVGTTLTVAEINRESAL